MTEPSQAVSPEALLQLLADLAPVAAAPAARTRPGLRRAAIAAAIAVVAFLVVCNVLVWAGSVRIPGL